RYFLYCEEVDWCLRRGDRRLGYSHDSIVYHSGSTTLKPRSNLSVYLDERNKLLITRRFYSTTYPLVVIITVLLTLRYFVAGSKKNFGAGLCGGVGGLGGEEGPPYLVREAAGNGQHGSQGTHG